MTETKLAKREATLPAEQGPLDLGLLMQFALQHGKTEDLERLVAMRERMEARAAEREFAEALAAFQAECPPLKKTKAVMYSDKPGAKPIFHYAPLDQIAQKITPLLFKHGLSFSHDSLFTETTVDVVCVLRHRNGHKESSRFTAPLAAVTQAMSPQQRAANALQYGRRYSLIQVLGLTTTDDDIELPSAEALEFLTPSEAADLEAKIMEVGSSKARLLKFMGVERVEDIRRGDLKRAVDSLTNPQGNRTPESSAGGKTQAQILLEERRKKGLT